MYDETKVAELQREFAIAIADVEADMPDVECGFEVDLAMGVVGIVGADAESAREFYRRELGFVPTWAGV